MITTTKKHFSLILLITVAFLGLSESRAQTQRTDQSSKPTVVIVHGAWGGAWAFKRVDTLLRAKGYNVYRAQLTGQGDRLHLSKPDIGLNTHIDDVVNVILFEDLRDIVLVGHSYGGMVITGVADHVPERIRRLVYLDAFVPDDGESLANLVGSRADWLKQMTKGDYIVPAWVKARSAATEGCTTIPENIY
jgi:pimeloyl-ACP methyl ester carboxylesterase